MIDYWSGFWANRAIKWGDHRRVRVPPEYHRVYPRDLLLCIYPADERNAYQGKPTVVLTIIHTFYHHVYHTLLEQTIPDETAAFNAPVVIKFSYVQDKYAYASKCYLSYTGCSRKVLWD